MKKNLKKYIFNHIKKRQRRRSPSNWKIRSPSFQTFFWCKLNWAMFCWDAWHTLRLEQLYYCTWWTCPRNDIPLKISWCFPKWVFGLVFLGVLICDAISMGSVSFIKSRVSPWILHTKFVSGCPKYWLNSRVFWSKI